MAQIEGKLAESGLGQDERSALLGSGAEDGAEAMESDFSFDEGDPTQLLLMALGHFQRILKEAQDGADDLWSDECMNQLILGVEISLSQSWTQLVDAFTDAGRVLQTYESAGQARDALPFLHGAYDLLCGIVGEVMGGDVRPQVLDKWQDHYAKALKAINVAGLALVDDNEAAEPALAEVADRPGGKAQPFEFPHLDGSGIGKGDEELPTLDELPPLEGMLPSVPEDAAPREPEDVLEEEVGSSLSPEDELGEPLEEDGSADAAGNGAQEEAAAGPEEDPQRECIEPTKVIVDIVDRICDELAELSDRTPENRVLAMDMIEGGVSALKREADAEGYTKSSELCDVMKEACKLMGARTDSLDERFTEICFAFCGVFIEAMGEDESENINDWRAECKGLISEWTPADELGVADSPQPIEEAVEDTAPDESSAPTPTPKQETGAEVEDTPAQVPDEGVAVESVPSPSQMDGSESQALFERAQRALASGDVGAAKLLALQAAAAIAAMEVANSEGELQECEKRLKESLDATVGSRGAVKEAEKMVKSGASQVAAGERAFGEAKERTAAMGQDLVEEEERITELEVEIAELQAKQEEGAEKLKEAGNRLNEAKGNESSVSERLDGLRSAEAEARKTLEGARQYVKDLHRTAAEVEGRMEKSREALTRYRISFEDIRQTIGEPASKGTDAEEQSEEMLF